MRSLNFAKDKNSKPQLDRLIHAALDGKQPVWDKKELHASDMTKSGSEVFCPRELHLMDHLNYDYTEHKRYLDTATRITFADGWDKQHRLTNDFLKDRVVGNWRCKSCNDVVSWGKFPRDYGCNLREKQSINCNWEYEEVRFHDDTGISGSVDFFVDVGIGKYVMVECKIMGTTQFEKLEMPLAEHRLRTQLYLHLVKQDALAEDINTDWAYILYNMRGHGKKSATVGGISPFKCYTVDYNKEAIQVYLNKAHLFTTVKNTEAFACGVCSSPEVSRAKKCPVKDECFSGKYPAQVTWQDKSGEPVHADKRVLSAK